jgi:hypothetical protein
VGMVGILVDGGGHDSHRGRLHPLTPALSRVPGAREWLLLPLAGEGGGEGGSS